MTWDDGLMESRGGERTPFGDAWCGPSRLSRDWQVVARYRKEAGTDGLDVDVYCSALPARFYRIVGLPGINSIGEPMLGFDLSTGSGQAQLAADIARAACEGMLGVCTNGEPEGGTE